MPRLSSSRVRTVSFIVAISAACGFANAQAFTRLISFGDSLTDVGNTSDQTFGISPGSAYYQGRFSNGPLWIEAAASKFGLVAPTPSRKSGNDFAAGGSESGSGSVTPFPGIHLPNAGSQVNTFLSTRTPGANDLVTLWTGANDFLDGQTNAQIPADNIKALVVQLANAGIKNIAVPNLPLLGETPEYRTTTNRVAMDTLTMQFNADLAADLDSLGASFAATVYRIDVASFFASALANPAAYGFTNVTDRALRSDNTVVANPDQYLFWDDVHPTRIAHAQLGVNAFETLSARHFTAANGDWNLAASFVERRVPDATSAVTIGGATSVVASLSANASVRTLTVGGTVAPAQLRLVNGIDLTVATSPARIAANGTLAGRGRIVGDLRADSGGNVSPGDASTTIGRIDIAGAFDLEPGARLTLDLAAADAGDRLVATGAATLAGEIAMRFVDGFIGLPGSTFTLASFGSSVGTPTLVNQTGFAGLSFLLQPQPTSLRVQLSATPGDANLDAHVNFDDLLAVAQNYGATTGQTWLTGDFTGDSAVGFDDLLALAQHYGSGNLTNAGSLDPSFAADWALAQSLVPEPTLMLSAPVGLALGRRRRR